MTHHLFFKLYGKKEEVLVTDRYSSVEEFARSQKKDTWEISRHYKNLGKPSVAVRGIHDSITGKFYFINGLNWTHEQLAEKLNISRFTGETFIYYIGEMNEVFEKEVKEFLIRTTL